MSHVKLTVTIEEELYNKIESDRKFESRSSFVNRSLKSNLKKGNGEISKPSHSPRHPTTKKDIK